MSSGVSLNPYFWTAPALKC